MKKEIKILMIILVSIIVLGLIVFGIDYTRTRKGKKPIFLASILKDIETREDEGQLVDNNMAATMRAVVIKVYETGLMAMQIDENSSEVISLGIHEDIGFKRGQEILIHYNGMIMETYPAQLGNVGKVEIIKEKSNVVIPNNILRDFYSFGEKVNITVLELTNTGVSLTITDTNELPYDFAHSYTISKKVKNENYTGKGQKNGEDTENSTAGFTRYWS